MNYWKAVLHRIVEVIKFFGAKGLSFRELLAQFDPFIAQHIEKYGNRGKGTPSYLSSTIYEELLLLMKNDIIKIILKKLKAAKYYSLTVDSTPEIANVDQLVIALRYVLPSGVPAEIFLIFIPNSGHKSEEMHNVVMDFLNSHNIPIENCRGQSYDNARNMSVTRWSARFDACHALFNSYAIIIEALHSIVDNQKEKAVYKVEANGLLARLKTLETGLMIYIWNSILNSFNATNKKLQSTDIDLHTVLDLYNGLENCLVQIRDDFNVFKNKAVEITDCSEYAKDFKRKKKRKVQRDNGVHLLQGKSNAKAAREFIHYIAETIKVKVAAIIAIKNFMS
ncbi:uncharacterized protein LOC136086380 [Hydra vulgaris]|uniref:Uncharacterized protein LOC136086380 n=1 Tax=Hydra vulgaris TaxID=6087 RepID=A0ABM4CS75_HYDVU